MKKVVIPVVTFLVLGLGTLIFFLSISFAQVQYQKDTEAHLVSAGDVTATYAGQTTRISAENMGRVQWVLTISERQRVFVEPDCSLDDAVSIFFPDGAQYAIFPDDSADDAVYLCYTDDGKDLWLRIEGYNVMDWAVRIVSPEGIYAPNEVIEP